MAIPFGQNVIETASSSNYFRNDGVFVPTGLPEPFNDVALISPTRETNVQLAKGSWIYYVNPSYYDIQGGTVPDMPEPVMFAPLANANLDVNDGEQRTRINLTPVLVDDPYSVFDVPSQYRTLVEEAIVPDQLKYTFKNGISRQLLSAVVGEQLLPDVVDMRGFAGANLDQGVLPTSHAHALAQLVNVNRTTSHITQNNSGLDVARTVAETQKPSRMAIHYNAMRMGKHVLNIDVIDPAIPTGTIVGSRMGPPISWVPIYAFKSLGAANETIYDYPRGAALSDPMAPGLFTPSVQEVGKLFHQATYQRDTYSYHATMNVSTDMNNLFWRNVSNPSLGVSNKQRVSAKRLHKSIKNHLARGIPVHLHVNVYQSWANLMNMEPLNPIIPQPQSTSDAAIGSHHFSVLGYTSDGYYHLSNSFGEKVGDNGFFLMHEDYISNEQKCGPGAEVYFVSSSCYSAFSNNIAACAPKTQGCGTNQSQYFSWRSLFT